MGILALVLLAVIGVLWFAGKYSQGDPKRLIALAKQYGMQAGGAALLAFSAFSAARGNWMPAIVLTPIGFGMLQINPANLGAFSWRAGRQSRISTAYFEFAVNQSNGAMSAKVVAGSYAGRDLAGMDRVALLRLRDEVRNDPGSLELIEAYLDRRLPGWREHINERAGARQGGAAGAQVMTQQEAYQVLGLHPGASVEAIRAAHRTLMKRFHPDTGGSTWLAAKINAAKDILLARHG